MIGLLKKAIVDLAIRMRGNSKRTSVIRWVRRGPRKRILALPRGRYTLGARDFSSAVSGFCQVFIVTRAPLVASAFGQHRKIPTAREKNPGYRRYKPRLNYFCDASEESTRGEFGRKAVRGIKWNWESLGFPKKKCNFSSNLCGIAGLVWNP